MKSLTRFAQMVMLCLMALAGSALAAPDDAVWIDVRTVEEYQSGHLREATNIEHQSIVKGVEKLGISPDQQIFLYCRSGNRAGVAELALREKGYLNVTNVGGLEDARKLRDASSQE